MQLKAFIRQKYNPGQSIKFFPHITQDGYTVKNVHVFVPVFLYAVTMLIFQIKRIISSEKWFHYVVTFCFENAKNMGRSDDAKWRKKRGWPVF